MKIKHYLLTGVSALSIAALSSCVDGDYDLSDIDTTAKFQTKNLVVPINLDTITLDQVLDLDDDDSTIVKTTDAEGKTIYAIEKTGTFTSEDVEVKDFSITIPAMNPTKTTLDLEDLRKVLGFVKVEGALIAHYDIKEDSNPEVPFESPSTSIDESIKKIDSLGVTTQYINKIKVEGLSQAALQNTKLTGLKIQYPKRMAITPGLGTYNPKTGILDLSEETLQLDSKGELTVTMNVEGIAYDEENISADYDNHVISYSGSIKIKEGQVSVYIDTDLENTIKLTSEYYLETIQVHTFTGELEYKIEDFQIDPIHIDDLPDILSQSGTEINLENPQIYLSLNNPFYEYDILFQTDLELTAMRNGQNKSYRPDNGTFKTQSAKETDNEFVLSPEKPDFYYEGYADPQHVPFSGLRGILSDLDGIPNLIEVDAIDPMMPKQRVANFILGKDYGTVIGDYTFFSPLQLSESSRIIYTDTIDGWNDEDVDAITIEELVLNFDVWTEVPFDMELTVRPIDTTGKPINGVECTTATIPAKADNHHVEVSVKGTINHLDGILLEVRLVNRGSNTTLAPDMKLHIKNSKATVTGSYEKEL